MLLLVDIASKYENSLGKSHFHDVANYVANVMQIHCDDLVIGKNFYLVAVSFSALHGLLIA
jgi:hypothetical protein